MQSMANLHTIEQNYVFFYIFLHILQNNCDTGHNHPDHSRHSSHHLVITSKIKLNQKS